jgi:hypothetical protein
VILLLFWKKYLDKWLNMEEINNHTFLFLSSRAWQVRYQSNLINELRSYYPDTKQIIISIEKWTSGNASSESKRLKIPCMILPRPSQSIIPFWSVKNFLKEFSVALDILRNDILKLLDNNGRKIVLFLDHDDDYIPNLIINLVKSKLGTVILYQHGYEKVCEFRTRAVMIGLLSALKHYIRHFFFIGFLPIYPKGIGKNGSDLNLVFSERALLIYKKYGVKEKSLKIVGNMSVDHFFNLKRKYRIPSHRNILVCTPGFYRMDNPKIHRTTTIFIKKLIEEWGGDVNIDLRLKPGELPIASKELHNLLLNGMISLAAIDEPIAQIGKEYDFVISYSSSNVAFECIVARTPVVIYKLDIENDKYYFLSEIYKKLDVPIIYSEHKLKLSIDAIYKKIEKPIELKESIIWDTGPIDGNSSKRAAAEINKFLTNSFIST